MLNLDSASYQLFLWGRCTASPMPSFLICDVGTYCLHPMEMVKMKLNSICSVSCIASPQHIAAVAIAILPLLSLLLKFIFLFVLFGQT